MPGTIRTRGTNTISSENVRHGIRTPDDAQIWRRIEHRRPVWLLGDAYAEAILFLLGFLEFKVVL